MVPTEKRLLWHPRNDSKFVVGGSSQITLYEWVSEFPEIRHVTSQHDLHFMRCFAWSPDTTIDDLMAVGLSTGKVDLIRIEAGKHARQSNILSNGPTASLSVRNTRSCNALAFCNVNPGYLAVGLDKVRGDCSLVIWDISSMSAELSLSPISSSVVEQYNSPSPHLFPQIPRADTHPRSDSRILQQHAPTEIVSSLAFLPKSSSLLLAGISHRWLRLFDLRSPSSNAGNVASKVQGIATDPFDEHRIACFGDGVVTLWDARKLVQPLLLFSEKEAEADGASIQPGATFSTVEFSSSRRGCIATLEKESGYVRFWNLLGGRAVASDVASDWDSKSLKDSVRSARKSWAANLPWPTGNQQAQNLLSQSKERESALISDTNPLILAGTCRTKTFAKPISSFALVPSATSYPLTSNVMVVNREGDLELYAVHDTPKIAPWSAKGDMAMVAGTGLKVFEGYHNKEPFTDDETGRSRQPSKESRVNLPNERDSRSRSRSLHVRDEIRDGATKTGSSVPPFLPTTTRRRDADVYPTFENDSPAGKSQSQAFSPAASSRKRRNEDISGHGEASRPRLQSEPILTSKRDLSKSNTTQSPERAPSPSRFKRRQRIKEQKSVMQVIEDDISMVMKRRVLAGYGLSKPQHNILVTQDSSEPLDGTTQILSELWTWISHSQEYLCNPSPRIYGYDFAYQGLSGIWEGFSPMESQKIPETVDNTPVVTGRSLLLDIPVTTRHTMGMGQSSRRSPSPVDDSSGKWMAALNQLASRHGADRSAWRPPVATTKLTQRQIALQLCGWSLRDEELTAAIMRWEKEGKISRAACWLVFTKQYSQAVELLMRSDDEADRMMSGTVAALTIQGGAPSTKSVELREHCERLIVRLQDPYFRAMLTHLALGDWSEVLDEEVLPFRERLAIAFQFLDDRALSSYLRRTTEQACSKGDIDAIIVTGLTRRGLDVLQAYLDRTGDVQTAAIMSAYVCPSKVNYPRSELWLEVYRDLLDGFKLFHHRVGFDIERGQILVEAIQSGDMPAEEWVPRQILIKCRYCNKPVNDSASLFTPQQRRPNACPHCNRALPKCSVCLMTLRIVQDPARELEFEYSQHKDTIDEAIVICQTCRHGGHAAHILEWFLGEDGKRVHDVCPVTDCDCRCADEF